MNEKQKMIDKVSVLYREGLQGAEKIRCEMEYLKERMKTPSISHAEYVRAENKLEILKNRYDIQTYFTQGISMAREALFSE